MFPIPLSIFGFPHFSKLLLLLLLLLSLESLDNLNPVRQIWRLVRSYLRLLLRMRRRRRCNRDPDQQERECVNNTHSRYNIKSDKIRGTRCKIDVQWVVSTSYGWVVLRCVLLCRKGSRKQDVRRDFISRDPAAPRLAFHPSPGDFWNNQPVAWLWYVSGCPTLLLPSRFSLQLGI